MPDGPSPRELILIAEPAAELRVAPPAPAAGSASPQVTGGAAVDLRTLNRALADEGGVIRPLFGTTEDRVRQSAQAATGGAGPDLSVFYKVDAPDAALDVLAVALAAADGVAAAYVKPPVEPAARLIDIAADLAEPPTVTPDFTPHQFYLGPAPRGVDARFGWARPGGAGAGVRVIDVEGSWRFDHEDLLANSGGLVGGTHSPDLRWRNHGTAVVGVLGADRTTIGVTGIVPDAFVTAVSVFGPGQSVAGAIRSAADRLLPGDVLLIEIHRPGPRHDFSQRDDQAGYIAVEWWDDDFAAIQYATARGVIVVEAAGNGAENLDAPLYDRRPAGFALGWTNPFRRANRDCGAIIVGAGAPPPGTHGRDHGPDRSRLGFSNFGAAVDAQGVGREVTTTGYGDLQGGPYEIEWYTDQFSGTSSSSPIVVGAIASVQGALRSAQRPVLTPAAARAVLRSTGSRQQDAPGRPATQRIGNRPDIRALLAEVLPGSVP